VGQESSQSPQPHGSLQKRDRVTAQLGGGDGESDFVGKVAVSAGREVVALGPFTQENIGRVPDRPGAYALSLRGREIGRLLGTDRLGGTAASLRFTFITQGTKMEAYRAEGALLKLYYELFGELPPLNYKHNWSAYEDEP
jgi:hypothetical protein